MAVECQLEENGVFVVNISGQLDKNEMEEIQKNCEAAISQLGQVKILVFIKDFAGWEKGQDWEDTSFSDRNDQNIKKMAIVGEEQWRDMIDMFTLKGLRPVAIEYFTDDQKEEARQWLLSD